jgi:hypothetical protein
LQAGEQASDGEQRESRYRDAASHTCLRRKQSALWSFTMPTACMKA